MTFLRWAPQNVLSTGFATAFAFLVFGVVLLVAAKYNQQRSAAIGCGSFDCDYAVCRSPKLGPYFCHGRREKRMSLCTRSCVVLRLLL